MNFVVIYQRAAEDALASAWMDSDDPQAITDAANELDRALRNNARNLGESREGNQRVAFEFPLVAAFEVHETMPLVIVREIIYRPRRS
jgi:CHASE3 domain sensor protein